MRGKKSMNKLSEKSKYCQYHNGDLALCTYRDARLSAPLRRFWFALKRFVWYSSIAGMPASTKMVVLLSPLGRSVSKVRKKPLRYKPHAPLNLKAGDCVEVRSAKEIFATLDTRGKLGGLAFTAEMAKFCGRKFKVRKRLEKIILETTGELRRLRMPTVLLEGAFCDDEAHSGCDRSCFCFWREEWLRRAPSDSIEEQK